MEPCGPTRSRSPASSRVVERLLLRDFVVADHDGPTNVSHVLGFRHAVPAATLPVTAAARTSHTHGSVAR